VKFVKLNLQCSVQNVKSFTIATEPIKFKIGLNTKNYVEKIKSYNKIKMTKIKYSLKKVMIYKNRFL